MSFYERDAAFKRALAAAIVFSTLSLLPAAGIAAKFDDGKIGLPTAHAQVSTPGVNQEVNTTKTTTSIQNASTSSILLSGLIGSLISIEGVNVTDSDTGQAIQGDYAVTGRWRMFVNEGFVQRFAANFTLAKADGSEYYNNIFIRIIGQYPFAENASSSMTAQVFANSTLPSAIVSINVEIRDKVLKISDIKIFERMIEDDRHQDILQIIDGQQIYGIAELQRRG